MQKQEKTTFYQSPATLMKPMLTISGLPVRYGMFHLEGANVFPEGVNFTIHTHYGRSCELLLFHLGEEEPFAVIPFPDSYRIGDVYSIFIFGLDHTDLEYAYRVDGPHKPKKGHLFDKHAILLDPYARSVTVNPNPDPKARQPIIYRGRVVADAFDWGDMPQSKKELSDLIIYEMHVRGFTRHDSSKVASPGTFAGLKEKIPYLKELGVNCVELMPVFQFDENAFTRTYNGRTLVDYWGYNSVAFFAPHNGYSSTDSGDWEGQELKELIKELHANDIEVILDVVFNHTAEGNELGSTFSFKGLDNKIYYMLTPDANYYNFSGCGNTFNCNHPIVRQMILECLRYWTIHYRVDGFRFDLASILGRNLDGSPMNNPPLLEILANDLVLSNVKLIAEAWDAGGLYQVGSFPASHRWAEWNGRYRDSLRSYLKGESQEVHNALHSIAGSGDLYGGPEPSIHHNYAGYNSCINFLTCHDGFTLYDLYSYNDKHNEDNGWNSSDGANDNRSWNCGAEGETKDPKVLSLRYQMIRNACAVLMCSRGTPMFLAGDEFANSQFGNNNSYCQDNEISWLDWSDLEKNKDLYEFFRYMIQFRKDHPILSRKLPDPVSGMEPLSYHSANGDSHTIGDHDKTIAVSFCGYDKKKGRDDTVYIAVNTNWVDVPITLPTLNHRGSWYLCVNTSGDGHGTYCYPENEAVYIQHEFLMRPRSVAVFIEKNC